MSNIVRNIINDVRNAWATTVLIRTIGILLNIVFWIWFLKGKKDFRNFAKKWVIIAAASGAMQITHTLTKRN